MSTAQPLEPSLRASPSLYLGSAFNAIDSTAQSVRRRQEPLRVKAGNLLPIDATAEALEQRARLDPHRAINDIGCNMGGPAQDNMGGPQPARQRTVDHCRLGLDRTIDRTALDDSNLTRGEITRQNAANMDLARTDDIAFDSKSFA